MLHIAQYNVVSRISFKFHALAVVKPLLVWYIYFFLPQLIHRLFITNRSNCFVLSCVVCWWCKVVISLVCKKTMKAFRLLVFG